MANIKGYKVFNPDWTCRDFQYEVGKTYETEEDLSICRSGFHFCKQAAACFNYYCFDPSNKVAEVIALGEVIEEEDKCCTSKLQIVRELSWIEVLTLVNTGMACTGLGNSGDYNSGNHNTGNCNSGNYNSGDNNSGRHNSGNYNSGNRNSGDYNTASNVVGCFNTENQKLRFFDKETDMTLRQWRNSKAYSLLQRITGGYLKINNNPDCCQDRWDALTQEEQSEIKNIPNFDADKFFTITGIRV